MPKLAGENLFSSSAHINLANRLGYLTKQKVFNSTLVWLVMVMDCAPHVQTGSKDVAQKVVHSCTIFLCYLDGEKMINAEVQV